MKARIIANGVQIREKNSNTSPAIGFARMGEEIDIEAEYGEWVKLTDGGWIMTCYTEAIEVSGGGGGVTSWNDLTDKPFYDESMVLYEGYPEYAWGYAKLPFVLKEGVKYEVGVFSDDGTAVRSLGATGHTAADNGLGVIELSYVDIPDGEYSFKIEYQNDGDRAYFYPQGSAFREGQPEESADGSYAYTSKVKIRVEYRNQEDAGVVTLDPKYLPKAEAVADVAGAPTAEDFNALLASLRAAGYLAE